MQHNPKLITVIVLLTLGLATLNGCGGNANRTPATSSPTSGATGTTQYQVTLHNVGGASSGTVSHGSVTVTTAGDVTVQASGLSSDTTYSVSFCVYEANNCFDNLATITTDSNGGGRATFHFPKSGLWAGVFRIFSGTTNVAESSGIASTFNASPMQLEPISSVTGQIPVVGPQDPGSGTLTASNGNIHVNLAGGIANKQYTVSVCYMGSSSCQNSGTFTTGAAGNASADITNQSGTSFVEFFVWSSTTSNGLMTGFKVP